MERGGRNGNSNGGSPRPPSSAVVYRVKVVGQPRTLTCRIDPGAPVSALRIAVVATFRSSLPTGCASWSAAAQ